MSMHHDPELDDVLQDQELLHLAGLLSSASRPQPPLDEAFRSDLRRQLMHSAWEMGEGRMPWWRRAFAPPAFAWVGAAAGVVLIASVVVYMAGQPAGGFQIQVTSPVDGSNAVRLEQPILVKFNQAMNHPSTEAAVQIAPATTVAFSWEANTLAVQPTSGNLAPNTQYQVTIGPTAKTATGQLLASPTTITFVTEAPAAPTPPPSPTPRASATPGSLLTGERQLATLGGGTTSALQWAADSTAVYFINFKGALDLVPSKGGDVTVVAPDGASSPAIAPAGDRLAFIHGGKIEILTFAVGKTAELVVTPAATLVSWAKDKVVWAAADGIYTQGTDGPTQLAPLSKDATVSVLSIAPDGLHAILQQDQTLLILDLTMAKTTPLGAAGAHFLGWSPGGTQVLYSTVDSTVVADMQGSTVGLLPGGDPSWSSQDAILLGSDTDLYQVRPDGSGLTKLSNGTYHAPLWAPNGTAFVFFRGGSIWSASAPALPPQPTTLDQAATVVNSFMQARLKGQTDQAVTYLDANSKQAYAAGGINLTINGDPHFSRYYFLAQQVTATQPDTARFVVRLVLTHGKLDVSDFEETLTVLRDADTKQFVIDQATSGSHRDLGKGAEVVGVDVSTDTIKVTFDSDLVPGTVPDGIQVRDSKGKQIETTATYASRAVSITGINLKPGAQYKLVVLTTVRDVLGHSVASEYDLDIFGPVAKNHPAIKNPVLVSPSPVAVSPSPAAGIPSRAT